MTTMLADSDISLETLIQRTKQDIRFEKRKKKRKKMKIELVGSSGETILFAF